MKKKSNQQKTKKKNEFRYHNVILIRSDGHKIKVRHPAYIFLEKGNLYIYVSITHSNKVENLITIKLRRNPNPQDKLDSYRIVGIKEDTKDKFGRREQDWSIDVEDEQDIRDEYKKRWFCRLVSQLMDTGELAPTNHL